MTALRPMLCCLALLAPSAVFAQAAPGAPAPSDFRRLWTGWDNVNRAALDAETEAQQRVRRDLSSGDAERLRQLRNEGRALGERVGEIVRLGDCEDGERVARAAGDFALVEAVRSHCRRVDEAS